MRLLAILDSASSLLLLSLTRKPWLSMPAFVLLPSVPVQGASAHTSPSRTAAGGKAPGQVLRELGASGHCGVTVNGNHSSLGFSTTLMYKRLWNQGVYFL